MDSYEQKKYNTKRYKLVKKLLKKTFGYTSFRPHQYKIIDHIISEKDVTAILPTGYGKSLCFQLPALYTEEPAVVISPLIALMEDQKTQMEDIGISACCYNSKANKDMMEHDILLGKYKIIYITPESLDKCADWLDQLYETHGISMFAIDEAHCISSYGFDFRKSYRDLHKLKTMCPGVPILAVTATATEEVVKDINKVMSMKGIVVKTSFNRPNLTLHVAKYTKSTNMEIINRLDDAEGSHIIYCISKKSVEALCCSLRSSGIKAGLYHADLTFKKRQESQDKFMNGEYKVMVATIAFGMGINKADVRTVTHYGCPKNIESYYQEIGRAGRDGKESDCYMYYAHKDFIVQQKFISDIVDPVYRRTREKLLDIIMKFVRTKKCRKKIILDYFGDNSIAEKCNKCDNCINNTADGNGKDADKKLIRKYGNDMFRLLTVIRDVNDKYNCNFGKIVMIGIIRGSKRKTIPKTYYKHKFYGDGKSSSDQWWKNLLEEMMDNEYVESVAIKPMIYVPKITKKGVKFLDTFKFTDGLDDVPMELFF